jgi:hypothetical protein
MHPLNVLGARRIIINNLKFIMAKTSGRRKISCAAVSIYIPSKKKTIQNKKESKRWL